MALDFDFVNEIITVPDSLTEISMQDLINEIRDIEDELSPAMAYHKIADAYGKDDLGGGVYTAITVNLIPDWQLKFEDRTGPDYINVYVKDGNLVGGKSGQPIAPAAFVQVIQQSSAAGTISIPEQQDYYTPLKYLIGSLYETHTLIGNIIYWDPYSGSDTKDGTTPAEAVKTFATAQSFATANNHDVVIAIPSDPTGITTTTETLTVSVNTLRLRGPGYNFQVVPTSLSTASIHITASNVEVSGFYISNNVVGAMGGIRSSGDNNLIKHCWVEDTQSNGLTLDGASKNHVRNCAFEDCDLSGTGDGIRITSGSENNLIEKCIISDSYNGISVSGASTRGNVTEDNLIFNNYNYGLLIESGPSFTTVRGGSTISRNDNGNVSDSGTETIFESSSSPITAEDVADAVWDELISDHTASGTAGRTLRDAKTRATLASLK